MLVQIQQQKEKHKVRLSQILKNAAEDQCFGQFMEIYETTDLDENHQTVSTTKSLVNVCVNGLLMSKVVDESSVNLYVADDDDLEGV